VGNPIEYPKLLRTNKGRL